jgi:hypothetical protein
MRAWRTHEDGPPRDALHLDVVPIPEPSAGEVRLRDEGGRTLLLLLSVCRGPERFCAALQL